MSEDPFLTLCIPAYNEQDRIAGNLETISRFLSSQPYTWEVVVVDDGSTDNTGRILAQPAAAGSFRVIAYSENRGKGYAVRQGVLASRGEYVAFSDADLSAPIDELSKLFDALDEGYDIAIGSRAARGAQLIVHQPLYRELGGKGLNVLIRLLAVPGIRDTQCGFKLFKGDIARELFAKSFISGWAFDVEVLYLARKRGCKIAEVPVKWAHAEGSKIRPLQAGLQVVKDILRMRFHRYGDW